MSTIITRGGAKTWWKKELPPNVAYMVSEYPSSKLKVVTWADVFRKRTQKQKANETFKRQHKQVRACGIEVFYNDTILFHGWFICVRTIQKSYYLNWRNPKPKILQQVMDLFSCNRLLFNEFKEALWCEDFCKKYQLKGKKRKHHAFATAWCELDKYGYLKRVFKK